MKCLWQNNSAWPLRIYNENAASFWFDVKLDARTRTRTRASKCIRVEWQCTTVMEITRQFLFLWIQWKRWENHVPSRVWSSSSVLSKNISCKKLSENLIQSVERESSAERDSLRKRRLQCWKSKSDKRQEHESKKKIQAKIHLWKVGTKRNEMWEYERERMRIASSHHRRRRHHNEKRNMRENPHSISRVNIYAWYMYRYVRVYLFWAVKWLVYIIYIDRLWQHAVFVPKKNRLEHTHTQNDDDHNKTKTNRPKKKKKNYEWMGHHGIFFARVLSHYSYRWARHSVLYYTRSNRSKRW